jgi:hypothetical protein
LHAGFFIIFTGFLCARVLSEAYAAPIHCAKGRQWGHGFYSALRSAIRVERSTAWSEAAQLRHRTVQVLRTLRLHGKSRVAEAVSAEDDFHEKRGDID